MAEARRPACSDVLHREALDRYLEATPAPMPASIGAGDDPDLDARDAKRWLHERWTDRERCTSRRTITAIPSIACSSRRLAPKNC